MFDRGAAITAVELSEDATVKGALYEILSLMLIAGSLFFFFRCTLFLTDKDYLAATLTLFIGIAVVRVGVELARLAVIVRKEE